MSTEQFDVYDFSPHNKPVFRFSLDVAVRRRAKSRFVKACHFIDGDTWLVCGGDDGCLHVYSANSGSDVQRMSHATLQNSRDIMQVIAVSGFWFVVFLSSYTIAER
jgi:hypothetical protein